MKNDHTTFDLPIVGGGPYDGQVVSVSAVQLWARLVPFVHEGKPSVLPICIDPEGNLVAHWGSRRTVGSPTS